MRNSNSSPRLKCYGNQFTLHSSVGWKTQNTISVRSFMINGREIDEPLVLQMQRGDNGSLLQVTGRQKNFARTSTRTTFLKRLLRFSSASTYRSNSWNIGRRCSFSHFLDLIRAETRSFCLLASLFFIRDPRISVARVSTVTVIVTVPVNITATNASTVTNSTASECSKTPRPHRISSVDV